MTRKMAAIRKIKSIEPIEGADRIEKAVVDGWTVVVGKGQYKPGQRIIFCEIDSAIPVPRLDPDGSLAKRGVKEIDGEKYHVVKTVRLKGVYSQGLILPLHHIGLRRFFIGVRGDVSGLLGIFKYDPFEKKTASKKTNTDPNIIGSFPTQFAHKSDSERVQNLEKVLPELLKDEWVITEKLDGQSITLINDDGTLRIASRNYEIKDHPVREWAENQGFLNEVPSGYAVQGEWFGKGVNGNSLNLDGNDFRVFTVFQDGELLSNEIDWPDWAWGIQVPIFTPDDFDNPESLEVDNVVEYFDGIKSIYAPGELAEGVVFHRIHGETPLLNGRSTFKVISNKWLLKHDK